ncbi:MAG: hypothetical protein JO264_10815 [Acidisphaera sp.]|nr:hypothetical protein [Acidisphaera sp.]
MRGGWLAAIMLLGLALPATAQERPPHSDNHGPGVLTLLPGDSVTSHTLDLGDHTLAYKATAGTLPLFDDKGTRIAAVFYTAYVVQGADPATRPLTFVFNGGPGAASAYLHLGLVGPRIIDFGPDGRDAAAPALHDNKQSWLDFTDLVLIDPVGTGWSRADTADDAKKFWGVRQDARALAKVVALYVSRAGRATSPKYLLGESYGGMRAPKVAQALRHDQGILVSGMVLLSPFLDAGFDNRLALGAALQLPSLAAAEMERTHAYTPDRLPEIEHFALTDYLTALAATPADGTADPVYAEVAKLTGLAQDVVARAHGFVRNLYVKHSGEPGHEVVSRYDAAFAVDDPFADYDGARGSDPILDGYSRAFGGAFAGYARDELGFRTDITYELLADDVGRHWDWQSEGSVFDPPNVTGDLRELLAYDPTFRLLVAHGTSDLQTPYAVSRYVLDHLPHIGAPGRVQLKLYSGGHMVYLKQASRLAFTADARAFYGE